MAKVKKGEVENLVWALWSAYEGCGDDDIPEWGYIFGDPRHKEEDKAQQEIWDKIAQHVVKTLNVPRDTIDHVMRSIDHWKQCVVYDEREVSSEVNDWTNRLYKAMGKSSTPAKVEKLRTEVNKIVDLAIKDDPKVYFLGGDHKWAKELSKRTGVPEDDCVQILHGCHISRFNRSKDDQKYRESRLESFEQELVEYSIHIK